MGIRSFRVSSDALEHRDLVPAEWQMETVIEQFDTYRPRFEELVATADAVPMSSVKIRPPLPRPH